MSSKEVTIFDFPDFSFGRKFALLGRLYFNVLRDKLKHLEIEKQFSVLVLLDKMGDNCTQKFIADSLHMDKTMMVGVIDELSKRGFITRTQNPADRREYRIQLTAKAKKHMPEIKGTVKKLNESALTGFKQAEIEDFHKKLSLMYKNIKKLPTIKL